MSIVTTSPSTPPMAMRMPIRFSARSMGSLQLVVAEQARLAADGAIGGHRADHLERRVDAVAVEVTLSTRGEAAAVGGGHVFVRVVVGIVHRELQRLPRR